MELGADHTNLHTPKITSVYKIRAQPAPAGKPYTSIESGPFQNGALYRPWACIKKSSFRDLKALDFLEEMARGISIENELYTGYLYIIILKCLFTNKSQSLNVVDLALNQSQTLATFCNQSNISGQVSSVRLIPNMYTTLSWYPGNVQV